MPGWARFTFRFEKKTYLENVRWRKSTLRSNKCDHLEKNKKKHINVIIDEWSLKINNNLFTEISEFFYWIPAPNHFIKLIHHIALNLYKKSEFLRLNQICLWEIERRCSNYVLVLVLLLFLVSDRINWFEIKTDFLTVRIFITFLILQLKVEFDFLEMACDAERS